MKLHLDDDTSKGLLVKLLRVAGHEVTDAGGSGMTGKSDPQQLIHSIHNNCVLLTQNHKDFKDLNDLLQAAGGHHPGILSIRKDNDPNRDMTTRGIVNAVRKIDQSGVPLADRCTVLNQYR